jgi:NitT/TauT family transport system permease protein
MAESNQPSRCGVAIAFGGTRLSFKIFGRFQQAARLIFAFGVFLALWEAFVAITGIKAYILPPPSLILTSLWVKSPRLVAASLFTLQPMVLGYLAAVVLGVLIALAIAFSRSLEGTLYPLLVFFQIIPKIAVAPLFIIWFGFGLMPKVLLVFLLSFFPVVVSAITAFRSVDADIMDLARSTGASRLRTFFKIQIPHALPTLFTGFKVAAALSSTAAVVAEFVASDKGLGFLLLEYNGALDTTMTFATIIVLSVLGLALYGIVELIEMISIPWHISRREPAGGAAAGNAH